MRYGADEESRRERQEGLQGRYHEGDTARDGEHRSQREDFRGRGPRGYRRSNERIREDVCEGLTDDPSVDASEIEVEVEEAIVVLSGFVADRRQKRRAEDIAEQATGVRDVRNRLEIGDRELVGDLTGRLGAGSGASLGEYRDPRWRSADLRDFEVHARDGSIGTVDERSEVGGDHLIVDTGPWIFGKKVVLPVGLIMRVDEHERRLFVDAEKDEIKNAPEFDEDRLDDPSYGEELRSHYADRGRAREHAQR